MSSQKKTIDRSAFHKLCKKHNIGLNYYFALRQESSLEDIKNVIKCHKKKEMFERRLIESIKKENLEKVNYYLKKIVEWDFNVQEYWGFDRDFSKLTWIDVLYREHPYLSKEINKLRFLEELKNNT